MRDLSRASGVSLAGLYYYFESKERLLYHIQKHTFSTIVAKLKERLDGMNDPEERIRVFILNHLEYFLANQQGMKVLSHEDEALKNGLGSEIATIKRAYYRICVGLMDEFKDARKVDFDSRTAVMSLFGMINWIYTWYNPRVDGDAEELARRMGDIFLRGVMGRSSTLAPQKRNVLPALTLSSRAVRSRSRERARDPVPVQQNCRLHEIERAKEQLWPPLCSPARVKPPGKSSTTAPMPASP